MKIYYFLLFVLFSFSQIQAQIGISAAYKNYQATEWFEVVVPSDQTGFSNPTGWNLGVDYWFRLKNNRIEFLPEISFEQYESSFSESRFDLRFLNFQFNTNIYFLDFNNDCNCPTFSKDGNFFTKGFFVQLSPGVSQIHQKFETSSLTLEENDIAFNLGVGAGVDFGVSDFFTITPLAKAIFFPNANATSLQDLGSSIRQFYLGIRLGFRWKDDGNAFSKRKRRRSPFGR